MPPQIFSQGGPQTYHHPTSGFAASSMRFNHQVYHAYPREPNPLPAPLYAGHPHSYQHQHQLMHASSMHTSMPPLPSYHPAFGPSPHQPPPTMHPSALPPYAQWSYPPPWAPVYIQSGPSISPEHNVRPAKLKSYPKRVDRATSPSKIKSEQFVKERVETKSPNVYDYFSDMDDEEGDISSKRRKHSNSKCAGVPVHEPLHHPVKHLSQDADCQDDSAPPPPQFNPLEMPPEFAVPRGSFPPSEGPRW
ncbi:unnamed protein product [Cylindrotheca closterium]|nr:unnamed protein product [Cylindrotheca closterium]